MRCVRCEFENIPGQTRCIRCGSILEATDVAVEVHPPRMPAWRKPLRVVLRWLRGHRLSPEWLPTSGIGRVLDRMLSDNVAGLLLSIVPGLAHFLRGRFREVRLYVGLWLLCLILGLFLYGSLAGSLLIGLAIGLHAWIAIQYGVFREVIDLAPRAGIVLLVVALLTVLYWSIPRVAAPGISGGHTTLTIPAMNIHPGDYLLTRRVRRVDGLLPRGSLILYRPVGFWNAREDPMLNVNDLVIGQVVGLPGETIRIADGGYIVDAERLDPNGFPVPRWLQRERPRAGVLVPRKAYFVSTEYTIGGHGRMELTDAALHGACIVNASDIRGRAFMRWWPLQRRGFLE